MKKWERIYKKNLWYFHNREDKVIRRRSKREIEEKNHLDIYINRSERGRIPQKDEKN